MPLNPKKLRRELLGSTPSDAHTARAWKIYQNESHDESVRSIAQEYLIRYFFKHQEDIPTPTELNKRLIELMALKTLEHSILKVNPKSKSIDVKHSATYLSKDAREKYRVKIIDGKFINAVNGQNYDTKRMTSHSKVGFAAFTLNPEGEIFAFTHLGGKVNEHNELLFHSSMNAGMNVAIAGEIQIENGQLKSISTHSGHYEPSLFEVYYALEYFSKMGLDISQAKVLSFERPTGELARESQPYSYPHVKTLQYSTPATAIYDKMKHALECSIKTISSQIDSYAKGGLLSLIFRCKDIITGSTLTKERKTLAQSFLVEIKDIQNTIQYKDYRDKYDLLIKKLDWFSESNNMLSEKHSKKINSGRLSKLSRELKNKLNDIKINVELSPLDVKKEDSLKRSF